jgi:GNAT superfamily N-acetyltransferase
MRVRLANHEDVPRLCELLAVLFTQEAEFAPDADLQAEGLRTILSDNGAGLILVLEDAGEIIGLVNLLFTTSTFLGGRVGLLEDMIIDPAHRGHGHGGRLLAAAIEEARMAGCRRITLLTDGANAAAKAFYRKAGFVESSMTPMRLMLEP